MISLWKFFENFWNFCLLTENKISKAKAFLIYGFCLIDDWSLSGVNLASRDGEERVSD